MNTKGNYKAGVVPIPIKDHTSPASFAARFMSFGPQ